MQYDAVEFLKSLFQTPELTLPEPTLANLTEDWFVFWDERSAIIEYDGGLPREVAEHFALIETVKRMRDAKPSRRRM